MWYVNSANTANLSNSNTVTCIIIIARLAVSCMYQSYMTHIWLSHRQCNFHSWLPQLPQVSWQVWEVNPLCCKPFSLSTCATQKKHPLAYFHNCLLVLHTGSFCKCGRYSLWSFTLSHCERLSWVWESTVSSPPTWLIRVDCVCLCFLQCFWDRPAAHLINLSLQLFETPGTKWHFIFIQHVLILTNTSLPRTELSLVWTPHLS